jgi:hypothetical protein
MLSDLDVVLIVEIQAEQVWLGRYIWVNVLGKLPILHDDQGSHDQIAGVELVGLEKCQQLLLISLRIFGKMSRFLVGL